MSFVTGERPRAFVRVAGRDAEDYLQRMLSNDVAALSVGDACDALLLTPKARVIAPVVVHRRAPDDFLLLTEPELGERLRSELTRMRFAAQAEIEREEHTSTLVFDERPDGGIRNTDYGREAWELLDADLDGQRLSSDDLERMRIEARTPRYGRELDDRVLPAEAGLVERAVSMTKGCYPGQEPIARQHYRGKVNRTLRVLELDQAAEPEDELLFEGKPVGRITSTSNGLALAYVRTEVPDAAVLELAAKPGFARLRPLTN
jgi:folate-binding protein YgfZ